MTTEILPVIFKIVNSRRSGPREEFELQLSIHRPNNVVLQTEVNS